MILFFAFLSQFVFAAPTASLDGQYVHSCYSVGDDTLESKLQIKSGQWVQVHQAYEDENCQTPYLIFETQYQALVSGVNVDLSVVEVSYVSLTDEVTRALNLVDYCGFNNWKTQQKKVVTGLLCDEFQVAKAAEILYSIYSLQTKAGGSAELYLGAAKAGEDGKTAHGRYQGLESSPYIKSAP